MILDILLSYQSFVVLLQSRRRLPQFPRTYFTVKPLTCDCSPSPLQKNFSLGKIAHTFVHRCVKFPSRRLQLVRFTDIGIDDGKIALMRRKFLKKPLSRIRVAVR